MPEYVVIYGGEDVIAGGNSLGRVLTDAEYWIREAGVEEGELELFQRRPVTVIWPMDVVVEADEVMPFGALANLAPVVIDLTPKDED